jgi:hypothetical protein
MRLESDLRNSIPLITATMKFIPAQTAYHTAGPQSRILTGIACAQLDIAAGNP